MVWPPLISSDATQVKINSLVSSRQWMRKQLGACAFTLIHFYCVLRVVSLHLISVRGLAQVSMAFNRFSDYLFSKSYCYLGPFAGFAWRSDLILTKFDLVEEL